MDLQDNHPAFPEEKSRLDITISAIKKTIETLEGKKTNFIGCWSDRMVALQLAEMDSNMVYHLHQSVKQPYFARIDILEIKRAEELKLYIGKTGFGHHDPTVQIIDWRAPVAELYYSGSEGITSYAAPGGMRKAKVLLKRKFDIKDGKLIEIFDDKIMEVIKKQAAKGTAGRKAKQKKVVVDEFLNYKLKGNVDNKLKDIVATIQKEQNRIIRASKDQVVIVQGAAGSGKTTVALHRLSYLIYHNQDSFVSDKLLIIAPNRIFLDYISDILPELGVERVVQDTFVGIAFRLLGERYRTNETEKLKLLHDTGSESSINDLRSNLIQSSNFKASLAFKILIDNYLAYYRDSFHKLLPDIVLEKSDFKLSVESFATKLENSEQPLVGQIAKLKDFIIESINTHLYGDKGFRQGHIARIKDSYSHKIDELGNYLSGEEEIKKFTQKLIEERDIQIARMEKEKQDFIASYFKKWPQLTAFDFYQKMLSNPQVLKKCSPEKVDYKFLSGMSGKIFSNGQVEREDLAPLVYLRYRLNGLAERGRYLHIIVDEAQDLTAFEYEILKLLSEKSSFTIVGDQAQSIHYFRGVNDWKKLAEHLSPKKKAAYFEMELSYRSTMEIINFANEILKGSPENYPLAKPVIRHGSIPEVNKAGDFDEMMEQVTGKISALIKKGYKSIAVICKTTDQCQQFYKFLGRSDIRMDVNLITYDQTSFSKGISIVPIFMAKGLEFDAVCLFDASAKNFPISSHEIKLLYVAVTRALHHLSVFYWDELTPAISGMDPELFLNTGDPMMPSPSSDYN